MITLVANVPKRIQETKAIEINENSVVSVVPDEGFHGLKGVEITVNTPEPFEGHVYSGDCAYAFYGENNWLLKKYGDKITTDGITDAFNMFEYSTLENVSIDLNFDNSVNNSVKRLFTEAEIKEMSGKIRNLKPADTDYMFYGAKNLRYLPEFENLDTSYLNESTSAAMTRMFGNCYSLREIPSSLLKQLKNKSTSYKTSQYYYEFYYCQNLDEIIGVPVTEATLTRDVFDCTVEGCFRLKDFIFETNEDGTAKTANWKSQVINLSKYVGYANPTKATFLEVMLANSGITADKRVTNAEKYQALKDDADWFTSDVAYSRYNHDSAVRTINSLPDTSAYGTNTIKFKTGSGSATDGGSVDSLTDVEIAVATAKGWTVAYA